MKESYDKKIQDLAYDLFQYLAIRGLKPGQKIPEFDEAIRQKHAKQFRDGMAEFVESFGDYITGYARSWQQDQKKNNANYGGVIFEKILAGIKTFLRSI